MLNFALGLLLVTLAIRSWILVVLYKQKKEETRWKWEFYSGIFLCAVLLFNMVVNLIESTSIFMIGMFILATVIVVMTLWLQQKNYYVRKHSSS